MLPETIEYALESIERQRLRSYLTLLGIIIGIAAIVALVSMGEGLNNSVAKQLESLGTETIFVEPGSAGSFMAMAFSKIDEKDVKIIESVQGVKEVAPFYETSGIASYKSQSAGIFVIGVEPKHLDYLGKTGFAELEEGRQLEQADKYALMVYRNFVDNAFNQKVGLRQSVEIKGTSFKIVGVMKDSMMMFSAFGGTNYVIMPAETVKDVFDVSNPMELAVRVSEGQNVEDIAKRIESRLEREHGEKNFTVMTPKNILEQAGMIIGIIQLVLLGIAAISLVVGGIGIMNSMIMNVLQRTSEIGVMKSVGATNQKVLQVFLAEAGMIGLIGGIIGTILGYGAAFLMAEIVKGMGFPLLIEFNPAIAAGAIIFSMVVGIVSGFFPARMASRLDPTEALRYE